MRSCKQCWKVWSLHRQERSENWCAIRTQMMAFSLITQPSGRAHAYAAPIKAIKGKLQTCNYNVRCRFAILWEKGMNVLIFYLNWGTNKMIHCLIGSCLKRVWEGYSLLIDAMECLSCEIRLHAFVLFFLLLFIVFKHNTKKKLNLGGFKHLSKHVVCVWITVYKRKFGSNSILQI